MDRGTQQVKVLVTGAAGLLGRWVCKRLLARGDNVIAVDSLTRYEMLGELIEQRWPDELRHDHCLNVRSKFDDPDVFSLMAEEKPDAIVHAAAQTSHPRSIDIPMLDFEINALGTLRLLEYLRAWNEDGVVHTDRRPPRLVYISSAKIYGENVATPKLLLERPKRFDHAIYGDMYGTPGHAGSGIDGDVLSLGVTEHCPIGDHGIMTPFGVSKAAADLYVQQYAKLYGLDAVVLRPGCFTGPGSLATELQNWEPRLVGAMIRGEDFPVYGYGGKQVRDVLHVDDLARAVLACLDVPYGPSSSWDGQVFNVAGGPGNDISILEAVDLIERLTGRKGMLSFHDRRAGDWPWFVGSNAKITKALGWKPEIGVEETFRQLCNEVLER